MEREIIELFEVVKKLWTGMSTDVVATTQGTLMTDISDLPPRANSWHRESSLESTRSNSCKSPCTSLGSEALPKGIVSPKSDLEMVPLWGSPRGKMGRNDGSCVLESCLALCVAYDSSNDLIHAWGLDMKLGYCAQGDQSKNIGVVDSEYIVHKGLPTLGGFDEKMVRRRSYVELEIFKKRWQKAASEDNCWIDPYPALETNSRKRETWYVNVKSIISFDMWEASDAATLSS
ncbi:Lysine ketoglutarate reductase trans-splicing related [Musa troglodytarum]|uniref:Lysine ketoglutarate reductase trans-splicing related n=1 Tax=Musa troglodytarum TaxID=320322 RepID=A0A9E7I947_9LILI|nr:Lysine ketoglutarate reductase trans-splicing related [Musa troglodytarum]